MRGKRARFDDNTLSDGARLVTAAPDYQTVRRLGVGGMAEVFLAKDRAGKKVVIKRLFEEQARGRKNDDQVKMFLREAKFAGKLQHKNIVRVLDYGKDDQGLFIVMEYLRGYTLRELGLKIWQTGCMLPLETLLAIVAEVARGLDYAHNFKDPSGKFKGLIHRDVSPDNIFVCFDGTVKMLDFGIVKPIGSTDVTQAGILKGKFNFMAPELFETGEASPRTDVYALGVTLYLLCTGKNPHSGKEGMQLVRALMDTDPPRAKERNPDLPDEVDRFIMDLISRKPKKRLANCALVQKAIAMLLRGKDPMQPRELIGLVKNQKPLPLPSLRPGARPVVPWNRREANLAETDPGASEDKSDTSLGSDLLPVIGEDGDSERTLAATDPGGIEEKTRIEVDRGTIEDPTLMSSGKPASAPPPSTQADETLVDGPFPAAVLQEAARKYATTELRKKPPPSPMVRNAAIAAAFMLLAILGVVVGLYAGGSKDPLPTPGIDIDPNEIVVKPKDGTDDPVTDPEGDKQAALKAEADKAKAQQAEREQAERQKAEQEKAEQAQREQDEKAAEEKRLAAQKKNDATAAQKAADEKKKRAADERKAEEKRAAAERAAKKRSADAAAAEKRAADRKRADDKRRAKKKGRTVKLAGPSRIKWRANGKTIKTGSGSVQVPDGVKSIVAYDPVWGVKTKVDVAPRIDYNKLPRYPVVVRARPWAEVTIGRKKLGATPFEKPFMLVEGKYSVKLTWNDAKKTLPLEVRGSSKPVIVAADMRK